MKNIFKDIFIIINVNMSNWKELNKDRVKEYNKEYHKKDYEINKEKIKEKSREWRKNNKEKEKESNRLYYINNKEKLKEQQKEYQKQYSKTPNGIKKNRINKWKTRGLIGDYELIYKIYLATKFCDDCGFQLDTDFRRQKCMDHDHRDGLFRGIVCRCCNNRRK